VGIVRITTCYSTGRTETGVLRMLDGERRSLVIMCPWGQPPAQTVTKVWGQLTPAEQREVAAAFGLDRRPDDGA
jgi:hypothetical protein